MADASDQERTEQPSAKRREQARREGRVAVSHDLGAAAVLCAGLGAWVMGGGTFLDHARLMMERALVAAPRGEFTSGSALTLLSTAAWTTVTLAAPLILPPVLVAIGINLAQTRMTFAPQALRPQWSRLDPKTGLGRLFSVRGAVELVKALVKLALVAGLAVLTLRADWPTLVGLAHPGEIPVEKIARTVSTVWLRIGGAYLLVAVADYGFQWWQHEKSLRMTRDEAQRETKETEGNPSLRARLRGIHRQMARRRMMSAVKTADVVVRNPTHYAVALQYERGQMRAPKVVAKGQRLVALRIIELAAQHRVPVVENKPLAQALFNAVPVGGEIPFDLYRAVAELLAHVYSLKRGMV